MADDLKAIADAERAAKQLGLPFVRLRPDEPTAAALAYITESLAREYRVIPIRVDDAAKSITVAVGDPSLLAKPAPSFLQELKQKQGLRLVLQLVPTTDFEAALSAYATVTAAASSPAPVVPTPPVAPPVPSAPATPTPPPSPVPPTPVKSSPANPTPPAIRAVTPVQEAVPASVHSTQVPVIDLSTRVIPRKTLERFPEDVAQKFGMVVFELSTDGKEASVAVVDPADAKIRDILKFVESRNGVRIRLFRTDRKGLERALSQYGAAVETTPEPGLASASLPDKAPAQQPPVVQPPPPVVPAQVPLKQASADQVRTAAKAPASVKPPQPVARATELPKAPIQPVTPSVGQAAQSAVALGGTRSALTPSQYQAQVTRNSSTVMGSPGQPPRASVPTIEAADITLPAQPALEGNPVSTMGGVQPQLDERNLDTILGGQIADVGGLETAMKTGLIPKVVAAMLSYAITLGASDVHIEAGKVGIRIRYRIDGKLQEIIKLPPTLLAPVVSRIKILAKLKIDESRVPQDGRFDVDASGRQIDLRVSTLPTVFGEKVVLRLLDKAAGLKTLDELGITGTNLERVHRAIADPYGIVLVTGPTGSGKTTTLYAMLTEVNSADVNIVTLEDPVEYQLDGINQTQVRPKIGFGFADGLRSILRQDPNIIMVGEVRDAETAGLATQAALTGHLVLSTLHTNTAAGAIPRMIDMKVEPFLLSSSISAVIAQRLVRRLCEKCRLPASLTPDALATAKAELAASKAPEVTAAAQQQFTLFAPNPAGCPSCTDGFKGRVGIYEVLEMSESLAGLILKRSAAATIDDVARSEGMVTLRQDGILKALAGLTSLDEVIQATAE